MGAELKPTVRSLGRYELIEYLGSGGMSDVFVAIHSGLRRRVALKVLLPSLCREVEAVRRFLREGQCAARVSHPNVVDVLDVGMQGGVPYLVMELLDGETLERKLERDGPMSLVAAVELLVPILDGVSATHAAGVIHRDIKPSNILLARSADGSLVPKLVDFGIATVEERRNITGAIGPIGTPHYMSPEQARGERGLTERSDQYSLASVLYEMLTGREPFDGGDDVEEVLDRVSKGQFPKVSRRRPDLPPALESVLLRATSIEPSRRFRSVMEFAAALLPFASQRTRQLYVSLEQRAGVMSAQQLAERFHADNDVGLGRARPLIDQDPARYPLHADQERDVRPVVSRYVRREGQQALPMATPRFIALLGCVLLMGLSVGWLRTRGEEGTLMAGPAHVRADASPFMGEAHSVAPAAQAPSQTKAAQRPTSIVRRIYVTPSDASVLLDDISVGRGDFRVPHFTDGDMHELRVAAQGYVTRILLFRTTLDMQHIALEPQTR